MLFCATVNLAVAALEDGLVGYYSFDGHYNDGSGSTTVNNASAVGSPNINAAGLFNQGVYVSGGSNYVTLGQPADYLFGSSTSFTFTYWLKVPAAISSDPTLLGNKDWSGGGGNTGFVQVITGDDVKANIADGGTRKDTALIDLDHDAYWDGQGKAADDPIRWTFMAMTVDRTGNVLTNYVMDGWVINQWDDGSTPTTVDITGVGSLDSGYPVNIGQDGDGGNYTQLSATVDDMGIWRRALTEDEIWAIYQAGRQGHVLPWVIQNPPTESLEVEVGPYVQFTGPHTAVVRWDTAADSDSIVEYGLSTLALTSRVHITATSKVHEVLLDDIHIKDKYFYRVGKSGSGGEDFSDVFWFDNNINYSRMDAAGVASPYGQDVLTPLYEQAAEHIVAQSGITKGICLVYGCGEGRLAFELAKRTDMMIIGVDTDSVKIETAANKLIEAGVYGARVTVRHVASLDSLPFTKFMANLVVSDTMIAQGTCPGSATEMFRVLRPSGGVALLGQPDGCPSELSQATLEGWLGGLSFTTTDDADGLWSTVVRPGLPGAGWWSHAYGGPHNNGNSGDSLESGTRTSDFDLQWISWPGADSKVDRQVRGHSPVANKGRMVFRGFDRIITLDTYNGTILWSLEVPGLARFNIPRDSGWICIDDDFVFVAVKGDCWQLDAQTGTRELTHSLNDPGRDWGCVFRYNDKLYGSSVIEKSFYTGWWGSTYWYESQDSKICSKSIFANNLSGTRVWTYDSTDTDKGVVINSTICLGGDRIYFVESRNASAESKTTGRIGSELWSDLYMVALNADTGAKLWEKNLKSGSGGDPVVANGTAIMHLMYSDETLVLESSDTQYYIYAYAASDGTAKWDTSAAWPRSGRDHGSHLQRVVISDGRVWGALGIKGFALSNGATATGAAMPATNCGTVSAAGNVFMGRFNKGNLNMWDSQTGTLTDWSRIRPGCYINVVGCGGMVLAPDGGGGCDCYDGGFHTSAAFIRSED